MALICEDKEGRLSPVGSTNENATGFREITEREWSNNAPANIEFANKSGCK